MRKLTFRQANFSDWKMLLEWRNDKDTRKNSFNTGIVSEENHKKWLKKTLSNSSRLLLIAYDKENPVGTVRIDELHDKYSYEMSWTIAPKHRRKGYGKKMIKEIINFIKKIIMLFKGIGAMP